MSATRHKPKWIWWVGGSAALAILLLVLAFGDGRSVDEAVGGPPQLSAHEESTKALALTGEQIRGNPNKYVGRYVRLTCTVESVNADGDANSACSSGNDVAGDIALSGAPGIILHGDMFRVLDVGATVAVVGRIVAPKMERLQANNDATALFPYIIADYVEKLST